MVDAGDAGRRRPPSPAGTQPPGDESYSPIRPYVLTGGRTRARERLPPETLVLTMPTADPGAADGGAARPPVPADDVALLRAEVTAPVLTPDDDGFRDEVVSSHATAAGRPAVVVAARGAADVRAAVRFAAQRRWPVTVRCTGHGCAAGRGGGLLLSTRRMRDVRVDPARGTARLAAGVVWSELAAAAARHGFIPPAWSPSSVGVVGHTLGGGFGRLVRTFGCAADHVVSLDVVTADGRSRRVDADHEPELFWALRGSGGGFGVVVSMVVELSTVRTLWAGDLVYASAQAGEIVEAYRRWAPTLPPTVSTSLALLPASGFPELAIPRPRWVLRLRVAGVVGRTDGDRLLEPMRRAGQVLADSVGTVPATAVDTVADDEDEPWPAWRHGAFLADLPAEALPALTAALTEVAAAPPAETAVAGVELRQLGGAFAGGVGPPNCVAGRDAGYLLVVTTTAPGAAGVAGAVAGQRVADAALHRRLASLKGRYDPADVFDAPAPWDAEATSAAGRSLPPEQRAMLDLARPWCSVAELAARLRIPLEVTRIVVEDLVDAGLVRLRRPADPDSDGIPLLERVLSGLLSRI